MSRKKSRNFLITGIGGYYGGSLLRHFSETPPGKIIGIDIKKPAGRYPFLDFRGTDIRDPGVREILEREKIDTVLHLAFATNIFSPDKKIRDVNIAGTRNMLDSSVAAGVKKFVLCSSSTAYGAFPDNEEFMGEDVPIRAMPSLFYTRDKFDIENMLNEYRAKHRDMKFVVIRPSVITGRSIHPIFLFLLKTLYFMPSVAGHNPLLQFVHEDDLCRATALLMTSNCEGIYNVTGDGGVTYMDMLRQCGKRPVPLPRGFMLRSARQFERLGLIAPFAGAVDLISYPWTVSSDKLKKDFGFTFKYDSRTAFEEFAKQF